MGGFLTIGHCFLYCFLEIFAGRDKALMEGDKVVIGGIPQPPTGKKLQCGQKQFVHTDPVLNLCII